MGWITKPPVFLRLLYPGVLWQANVSEKKVFLTFDDGPVPGVTPWVIERLKEYGAIATFFCVGDNIRKYPGTYARLKQEGMETACHSFSHMPGHRIGKSAFLGDIDKGMEHNSGATWFRPPHGLLWPWWVGSIRKKGLNIAMWDILSRDYDRSLNPFQVAQNVIHNVRPGSVIVFHDSLKAWPNIKEALPIVLLWLQQNGYSTGILSSINKNKTIL